ncbi:MAG: GNAT family N-acetyltransferase [Anaerolineae bacterium]
MEFQIRLYTQRDDELLVGLLNEADAVDRMEQGTSLPELRELLAMPELDPEQNVFVAEAENGRMAAMGRVRLHLDEGNHGFRSWFEVHPLYRGQGLEDQMLARLQQRAKERLSQVKTARVYFACEGHMAYEDKLQAMERAGMRELRRFWVMVRPKLETLPAPQFPDNLIVRTLHLGEDDAEALDAMNDSFSEHFGHTEETLESFQYYLHSILYHPELTVLAIDPAHNRIAGFCHITINAGECERIGRKRGWIDILGVRKQYRRQGLGEALILQGMHNLRRAEMVEAALGCDSENTTNATALYFRTGFQVKKTVIVFSKWLREPASETKPEPVLEIKD